MKSSSVYLLTAQDCALLDRYKLIVDAIGQVFGNSCECVLHSLADLEHSVIHIHNGMKTGRVLGSPITDKALMLLKNCESLHQDITPVYQTVARNGSPMRSTTIIIRNNDRIPIGFLCINFDWGTSLSDLCHLLLPQDAKGALGHGKGTGGLEGQSSEMFVQNLDDLLLSVTCRIRDQIYADESITARNKTKEIVKAIDQEGLFEVKNSVSRIAKILNLSRDVVYLHLRSHRAK